MRTVKQDGLLNYLQSLVPGDTNNPYKPLLQLLAEISRGDKPRSIKPLFDILPPTSYHSFEKVFSSTSVDRLAELFSTIVRLWPTTDCGLPSNLSAGMYDTIFRMVCCGESRDCEMFSPVECLEMSTKLVQVSP